ncbi:MAG: [FeFe] hydrogenase H-cluster maturation GTPase HydF [Acutalibacteraceae bacterium]|nr:[FeFe] hydrogenase H-cluster maturation GTPase HydF [Acutalibacteraceae bacterium]
MSLNDTVSAERVHIGFFGLRNAGKSSLVNAVTGQKLSVVSEVKGTTTDPVKKAMELLPMGPVVIIDTPGIDDEGELGEQRVARAKQILRQADVAVLVVDAQKGLQKADNELVELFKQRRLPYVIVYNKADLLSEIPPETENEIYVSAKTGAGIHELKEKIAALSKTADNDRKIVSDLIESGDAVILVTPIDSAAPKGRLILPQQQTLRELLEAGALTMVVRETELEASLKALKTPPRMVITDSQAFGVVSKIVPKDVELTSFSILFARYKGDLATVIGGAAKLSQLKDGDRVLISEGCTHHRQCKDIGTVKLPGWINSYTGKTLDYSFTSGTEFPEDLSQYALVVHCGGCMLNEKEMKSRLKCCNEQGVPVTNYGIAIAQMHGILKRSLEPFPDLLSILN